MLADSYVKKEFSPAFLKDQLEQERLGAYLEAAGLEGREVEKLRRTLLSSNEAVRAKKEQLDRIRARRGRRLDWEEFIDFKRRLGRVMHHSEVVRRLRQAIPTLVVAPGGQRNKLSLYVVQNWPTSELPDCKLWQKDYIDLPIYVGWLDMGWVPEYEIETVNDVGVAIGQRRGWRTLLLRLIARRNEVGRSTSLLTEARARATFGEPTNGATASHYRRHLWLFRNGR